MPRKPDPQIKLCSFEGCEKPHQARGWCQAHYKQSVAGKELAPLAPRATAAQSASCNFEGCGRPRCVAGLCRSHDMQKRRGSELRPLGTPLRRTVNTAAYCEGPECEKPPQKKRLCNAHYAQTLRGGELRPLQRSRACEFDGCERIAISKGLCSPHSQQRKAGRELRPVWDRVPRARVVSGGYILVHDRAHPNSRKSGYIFEHVKVMSEHIGRPLWPDENVHHINGDRADNRIENLELWSKSQPPGQRVEDKLAWAEEMIKRYADHPYVLAKTKSKRRVMA